MATYYWPTREKAMRQVELLAIRGIPVRRSGSAVFVRCRFNADGDRTSRLVDAGCTCQAPEPKNGAALIANDCPLHGGEERQEP